MSAAPTGTNGAVVVGIPGSNSVFEQQQNVAEVLLYIAAINYLASILQGVTTFGDAIVLHILWHAMTTATGDYFHQTAMGSSDVQTIAVMMYSRTAVLNLVMLYLGYRSSKRSAIEQAAQTAVPSSPAPPPSPVLTKSMIAAAALPSIVMSLLGEQLLVYLPEALLRLWFGGACLLFAAFYAAVKFFKWAKPNMKLDEQRQEPCQGSPTTTMALAPVESSVDASLPSDGTLMVSMLFTSAASGLAGALTGVGGPPWMILILAHDLPASFVRVLFPISTLPSIYSRYVVALKQGIITSDLAVYHICAVCFGFAGVLTGYRIGKRIGPQTFNAVVLVLLTLAASMMLISNVVAMLLLLVSGVAVVAAVWRKEIKEATMQQDATGCAETNGSNDNEDGTTTPTCGAMCAETPRHYDQLQDEVGGAT